MLERITVPAQLYLGINVFCPADNAIYEITDIQGDSLHPDVTLKRCLYDSTLSQASISVNFDDMYPNYMTIMANS